MMTVVPQVIVDPVEDRLRVLAPRLASDSAAFEELYALLGPGILRLLRRILPSQDAEDVLQTTFADAWRDRRGYDPERPVGAWVTGIARHRAADLLRSRVPQPLGSPGDLDGPGTPLMPVPPGQEVAEQVVRARLLSEALRTISTEQREVLALAYFHGMTQTEIAQWLAIPLGTVKARAARGLRAVAGTLRSPSGGEPS